MIAVDTNILLYAHREESPWHEAATARLTEAARQPWGLPWPCVHEFLAIATHPRIFDPPSPLAEALGAVVSWTAFPTTVLLAEVDGYAEVLAEVLRDSKVVGPRVHDARIAALCRQHAIEELWTADRDFSRFRGLTVRNPLR
ncbi:MAG: type II toxin-antitoxin system VapC family toxin [Deltaproteobacteria bacterium]|nr:type II toxin-antitoxin system VapC family toxin [Deltaproteobacteria bacterium]